MVLFSNPLIIIILYIFLSVLIAFLGRRRKWGFWGFLWSSILLTPFVGFLCFLASERRIEPPKLTKSPT